MTWDELTLSLAVRLVELNDRDLVILPAAPHYVQLKREPALLVLEASSGFFQGPDDKLTPEQEFRLRALGWLVPDEWHSPNFWSNAPWPLAGRDARRLAGMLTASLRDVYGVTSADDVVIDTGRAAE